MGCDEDLATVQAWFNKSNSLCFESTTTCEVNGESESKFFAYREQKLAEFKATNDATATLCLGRQIDCKSLLRAAASMYIDYGNGGLGGATVRELDECWAVVKELQLRICMESGGDVKQSKGGGKGRVKNERTLKVEKAFSEGLTVDDVCNRFDDLSAANARQIKRRSKPKT
jgi:hypothetical protein